jgi:hypothetical protein
MIVQVIKASNGFVVQRPINPNTPAKPEYFAVVSETESNKAESIGEAILKIIEADTKKVN